MSRKRIHSMGLLCCVALLFIACQKKDSSKVPDAFDSCVAELAEVYKFAKSGLAGVEADQVESVVSKRLDRIGAACQPVFVDKVCSKAVANMKQVLNGGAPWIQVCRNAFCADDSENAACQKNADGKTVLEAIWSKDWGAKAGVAMRKRVEELILDPKTINALLMEQIREIAGAPMTIDMDELERIKKGGGESLTQSMTIKHSEKGMQVIGTSPSPILVGDLKALAATLKEISAGSHRPQSTGVTITGAETTRHQDIIDVMDQLMTAGYTNISIGTESDPAEQPPSGTPSEEISEAAVVTLSKTSVSVDGKAVGELAAGAESWQPAMVEALQEGHPGSSTLVIQADKEVLYKEILAVIDGARPAGFVDIKFAVNRN